jgi:hypothetical protein
MSIDRIYALLTKSIRFGGNLNLDDNGSRSGSSYDRSGKGRPEFRLPLLFLSSILVPPDSSGTAGARKPAPSGLYLTPWRPPFSIGAIMGFQCISNYLVDAYTGHAASAFGAVIFQRGYAGFRGARNEMR